MGRKSKEIIIKNFNYIEFLWLGNMVGRRCGGWLLAHLWAELLDLRVEWVFGGCDALSR